MTLTKGFGFLEKNSKPYPKVLSKNNNKMEPTLKVLQDQFVGMNIVEQNVHP
jgi:hypothetical protein